MTGFESCRCSLQGTLLKPSMIKKLKYNDGDYADVLEDYFLEVAREFNKASQYEFSERFFRSKMYEKFTRSMLRAFNCTEPTLYTISGDAGIGKSTFIDKGLCKLFNICDGSEKDSKRTVIIKIDFRDIGQNKTVEEYEELIMDYIDKHILQRINDCWHKEYYSFQNDFFHLEDINNSKKDLRIGYYNTYVAQEINKPIIYIIDNIDLSSRQTQVNVSKAIIKVFDRINNLINNYGTHFLVQGRFLIFFVKRNETKLQDEKVRYSDHLKFPVPEISTLYFESLKVYLLQAVKNLGDTDVDLKINRNGEELLLRRLSDVANYIIEIVYGNYFEPWTGYIKDRLGSFEEFHNQIVNGNIRKFINFNMYAFKNGGFEPIKTRLHDNYNVFCYVKMLIRGAFDFHPGNQHMDGEGFDLKSPIVMNLFDFETWRDNNGKTYGNYLIFIRILQYIEIKYIENQKEIYYNELKKDLSLFYSLKDIEIAIKKLLFANVIIETKKGIRNVQFEDRYEDIELGNGDDIVFSTNGGSTSGFYVRRLIIEFEYLLQVAVTTELLVENDDKYCMQIVNNIKNINDIEARKKAIYSEKEKVVFVFIKSISLAIKENLNSYKTDDKIDDFMKLFCINGNDECISLLRPWRRMMDQFIMVLNNKKTCFHDNESKSNVMQELINRSLYLQTEVIQYLNNIFDRSCVS